MCFKVFQTIDTENLAKYDLTKEVNFITALCIQYAMKENLLLLKDLLQFRKNKIYKHMAVESKNVYFGDLVDIMGKYDNAYRTLIKMKLIDFTSNAFDEYNVASNGKDHKLKKADHVKISRYEKIFSKGYTSNWLGEVFLITKIKYTGPWTYVTKDLNDEEIFGTSFQKELSKTNQKEFSIKKVIRRNGKKLYITWKGYGVLLIVGLIKKALY